MSDFQKKLPPQNLSQAQELLTCLKEAYKRFLELVDQNQVTAALKQLTQIITCAEPLNDVYKLGVDNSELPDVEEVRNEAFDLMLQAIKASKKLPPFIARDSGMFENGFSV